LQKYAYLRMDMGVRLADAHLLDDWKKYKVHLDSHHLNVILQMAINLNYGTKVHSCVVPSSLVFFPLIGLFIPSSSLGCVFGFTRFSPVDS
jgi:hypothetical protein